MKTLIQKMKNRPPIDVWHYIIGNYRYPLYYAKNWKKSLIRKHIREQIDFRVKTMDKGCYENGECKLCGCQTTHLQMSAKSCDKPCYPPMMNKSTWTKFIDPKINLAYKDYKTGLIWLHNNKRNRLMILTDKTHRYVQIN